MEPWRRPDTIAVAILLALTLVVMWQRWTYDNWLARHDLLAFFLPWLGALGDRLASFDIPALNPYIFSGAPFAGDPESGWMYLPAMLLFPFFEVTVAYKLMILLLLVLAGTSTYAFARLVGYSVVAALFSAVAFEFGPFLFGQTDCCTVATKMTAFLPLAFLGVELALRANRWAYRAAAWVICGLAISQMFAAWLGQGIANALLLVAAWLAFRTLVTPPESAWGRAEGYPADGSARAETDTQRADDPSSARRGPSTPLGSAWIRTRPSAAVGMTSRAVPGSAPTGELGDSRTPGWADTLRSRMAWLPFIRGSAPPGGEGDPASVAVGWGWRERAVRLFTTGPAILLIGLAMGAAGILPRLAANQESNNPGGRYEDTPGSRDYPLHTLASALRSLMDDDHAYRGTSLWGVVLVLLLVGVFMMRRRAVTPFFAVAAVVIVALAMGAWPIADLFYLLPLYEEMHTHSPGRVFWILPFVAAMLAGGAVNELPRLSGRAGKWLVALAPAGIIAIAAWYVQRNGDTVAGPWLWTSVIAVTLVLLFVAMAPVLGDPAAQERVVLGPLALLVALAFVLPNGIDLVKTARQDDPPPGELAMWGNDPWMQGIIEESLAREDPGGAGEFLQGMQETEGPFRFIAYGGMYHPDTVRETYPNRRLEPAMIAILQNARPMRLELETTQGYNPLQPMVYQEFIAALNRDRQDYHYANLTHTGVNSPLLDLLNVRYIVVDRAIPEERDDHRLLAEARTEVYRDERVIIYESPTAQRAWMVYDVRQDDGAGLSQLANGSVDGGTIAFVEGEPPDVAPAADGSMTSVTTTDWTEDSRTFSVSHEGQGLLVVSEIWSENWRATVDGEAVDVLQTDHALLGIAVGPGEHEVVVRYDPASLRLGLWASGLGSLGAIAVLGYAGWTWVGGRREPVAGPAEA